MLVKAERYLRKWLWGEYRKRNIPLRDTVRGSPVPYDGKGERFEFEVEFVDGQAREYEVTVYGNGRSFRIFEL